MGEQRCPEHAALAQFAAGQTLPDQERDIAAHLRSCPQCRQFVKSAMDDATDQSAHDATQETLSLSGSFLELDVAEYQLGEPNKLGAPTREDLETRFDFRLLDPPRDSTALGHLGKYTVRQVLGYGGMGVVFQAYDDQLLRIVALKVMSRDLATSAIARRRFIREARAAAAINHSNVVIIHAVEEHEGTPFLVMEFVQGESLRERLRRGPRLTLVEVLRFSSEVAAGLAAAHAHGVIHRDIKPANIMLEESLQRVKITDFGLARVAVDNVDLTAHETRLGTPAYMAPEQAQGGDIDARADLFTLGCVMYAMLRGHSPFYGRTALEIAAKVADERPAPSVAHHDVPDFLSDMIARLLEKAPAKRYQTAAEVADELRTYLAALNQTSTDKLEQFLRRRVPDTTRIWKLAAIAAVFICAAVFGGWYAAKHRELVQPPADDSGVAASTSLPADAGRVVTVAKTGAADCPTLSEALKLVGPHGVIKILDGGEYPEGVFIRDAQQHVGITIQAEGATPPTLTNMDGGDVVRIENVQGVTLRGLKIVQLSDKQHALLVAGSTAGVTIERTEMVGNSTKYSLVYFRSAWGDAQRPVVLRDSRIESPRMAVVIEAERPIDPVRHVQVLGNYFEGSATHVQLNVAVHEALIAGNTFVGGTGVAIGLPSGRSAGQITLINNTFFRGGHWLDLRATSPAVPEITIENNLILESTGSTIPSKEPLAEFVRHWTLSGNHWETSMPRGDSAAHGFAEIHESIAVVSRDPADLRFLQLATPLGAAKTPKTDAPGYVGAKAP